MLQRRFPTHGRLFLSTLLLSGVASCASTQDAASNAPSLTERGRQASAQLNAAATLRASGNLHDATQLARSAAATLTAEYGPHHPEVLPALNMLAGLLLRQQAYAGADSVVRWVAEVQERGRNPLPDPTHIATLANRATHAMMTGEFGRADSLVAAGMAFGSRRGWVRDEEARGSLRAALGVGAGRAPARRQNYVGAWEQLNTDYMLETALAETPPLGRHAGYARTLVQLAQLYVLLNDEGTVTRLLERALQLHAFDLNQVITFGSEGDRAAVLADHEQFGDQLVSLLVSRPTGDSTLAAIAFTAVQQRKGRSIDARSDLSGVLRGMVLPADTGLVDEYARLLRQWTALPPGEAGDEGAGRTYRSQLLARVQGVAAELRERNPALALHFDGVTLTQIQRALPQASALVEYVLYERPSHRGRRAELRYVAFVLRRGAPPAAVDLGSAEAVDRATNRFRRAISDRDDRVPPRAIPLYDLLMRPLRPLLADTRHLFVTPDGQLSLIPFAALTDSSGRYLARDYTFSYLTNSGELVRTPARRSQESPVVLWGAPRFDRQPGMARAPSLPQRGGWDSIPDAEHQLEAIRGLVPATVTVSGAMATEAAFKRLRRPAVLHVVTHGFFEPARVGQGNRQNARWTESTADAALRGAGIVFAGANQKWSGDGEDGQLTALELLGLDLTGTRLVVLSACETGLGVVRDGYGVYGFRRALLLAGAESQIVSLWRGNAPTNHLLMIDLYEELAAGKSRAQALADAQRLMLDNPLYAHPYYWASFILIGDWRRLQLPSRQLR